MYPYSIINFGQFIANFLPGTIIFIGFIMMAESLFGINTINIVKNNLEHWLPISIGFFVIILVLGLLVDGIKFAISRFMFGKQEDVKVPDPLFYNYSNDEFMILKFLFDNYYRYYQFYSNMALSVFIFTLISIFGFPSSINCSLQILIVIFSLILSIMLYFASKKSLIRFNKHTKNFIEDYKKGGVIKS